MKANCEVELKILQYIFLYWNMYIIFFNKLFTFSPYLFLYKSISIINIHLLFSFYGVPLFFFFWPLSSTTPHPQSFTHPPHVLHFTINSIDKIYIHSLSLFLSLFVSIFTLSQLSLYLSDRYRKADIDRKCLYDIDDIVKYACGDKYDIYRYIAISQGKYRQISWERYIVTVDIGSTLVYVDYRNVLI